jgi:peptidoglycan/LPS O-acetylase OafA/YrhL
MDDLANPETSPRTNPSSSVKAPRLPSLTGLRWWVALLVFLRHVALSSSQNCAPGAEGRPFGCVTLEWVFGTSAVGVTFFTVLSGFVIT